VKPIRVGDTVRIVNSRFIRRVGYPLVWYDLLDEVENDVRTWRAWKELTGERIPAKFGGLPLPESTTLMECLTAGLPNQFLKAVAMLRVAERRFGGDERRIIYCEVPRPGESWSADRPGDCTGHEMTVHERKHVKTGKRFSSGGNHEDYWPGGLDDMKVHTLLGTTYGWIEACDVELVRRGVTK
jgi:hypothetical protein